MAGCWVGTVLKITGYRPPIYLNRENASESRALLKSGRILPFDVLQSTVTEPKFSPMLLAQLQGVHLSFGTVTSHPILLFVTLSTDMLVTTWVRALACWLWSWSCITRKRIAWHSSVHTPRNISRCARLPGRARVGFHPAAQKAGLVLCWNTCSPVYYQSASFKFPAEGKEDLDHQLRWCKHILIPPNQLFIPRVIFAGILKLSVGLPEPASHISRNPLRTTFSWFPLLECLPSL